MIKSYHAIYQWNHWLTQQVGLEVICAENKLLSHLLAEVYGKHAVLIGVPKQFPLLESNQMTQRFLITPLSHHGGPIQFIEGNWQRLPIYSGSVDLVLLPHALEQIDHPRQLLLEACRIVKPEGNIIIFGFNPYSFWGLKHFFDKTKKQSFLTIAQVKEWLALADFELIEQKTVFFRPPTTCPRLFKRLHFLEWLGTRSHLPWGGIYMLMAKAKVIPLTPIRMRWKQELAGGIQSRIPRPITRNFQ